MPAITPIPQPRLRGQGTSSSDNSLTGRRLVLKQTDTVVPGVCRSRGPGGRQRSILRKEVIQPQVPLRLPCYDFTPVADPTVVACLPRGLAQRLRVEPTPMV